MTIDTSREAVQALIAEAEETADRLQFARENVMRRMGRTLTALLDERDRLAANRDAWVSMPEPVDAPPVAKYRYTLVVTGNSHDEILRLIESQARGGYLLDSEMERRDQFEVWGGRTTRTLEHTNPEMTPDRYERELDEWYEQRKATRW